MPHRKNLSRYAVTVPLRVPLRGRFILYALGFPAAAALDIVTPEGIADWLVELILVWLASAAGSMRELVAVSAIGSAVIAGGLWSAPKTPALFWMDVVNRVAAISIIWAMVRVTARRHAAEEEQRRAAREIKVLEGLLPICGACKAIRTTAGEWRRLESYLSEHSEAKLTHTLCPGCAEKFMEDETF